MRGLPGSPVEKPGNDSEKDSRPGKNKGSFDKEFSELQMLIDREHECPVCSKKFTAKEIKSDKSFSEGMDMDLRPRYRNIDPIKYRVVECPSCGYADMTRYFGKLYKSEIEALRDMNTKKNLRAESEQFARDYSEAYTKYKSAIRSNLIRGAKCSRRAYTALNAAWLLRGWRISLEESGHRVHELEEMSADEERKLIKYALKNFRNAETTEEFPINDMSEPAFDYLMGALCYDQGELDDAGKYVLRALQNKQLKNVLRPMAEDLRDMIRQERKKNKG